MKTAMQELIENLKLNGYDVSNFPIIIYALKKEKEQIVDAYCAGYKQGEYADEILCDEYYDETYKNDRDN